jgi:hypothetical protein
MDFCSKITPLGYLVRETSESASSKFPHELISCPREGSSTLLPTDGKPRLREEEWVVATFMVLSFA